MIALQLSRLSYTSLPLSTSMEVMFPHQLKACVDIEVTELGMAIEDKLLQPIKTQYSKFVTELDIVTDSNLRLSANAASPMVLTELGIVTVVRPV